MRLAHAWCQGGRFFLRIVSEAILYHQVGVCSGNASFSHLFIRERAEATV